MRPFASYIISLTGTVLDIKDAIDCIADVIGDQPDALPNLLDRYYSDDENDDDDALPNKIEETIEIWHPHDCVWIEDIETLSAEMAATAPDLYFSFSGHIEDPSSGANDEMDFQISYKGKKLFSQTTDWYWFIHMDDYPSYSAFSSKFCDLYGNPRYSADDYEGFRACSDEWYVMDGGQGEFSIKAPLRDPIRIKPKKAKGKLIP